MDSSRDLSGDIVTRPYLRVANVQAGYVETDSVTEICVPRAVAARSTLQYGDVLMTEGGDLDKLGRGAVWFDELPGCLHQNHVFALRPFRERLDGRYLALVTQSRYARYYFESTGTKTTNLASTNKSKILDFTVPIPPLDEQRRIVDFLDVETGRIDQLRALHLRQVELLSLRRERLIEEILGLGAVCEINFRLVPLKYLVSQVKVGIVITPSSWYVDGGGVPSLRGLNIRPGIIKMEEMVQISRDGDEVNKKSRLRAGDVVVVRTGQAGAAAVVPSELDGANCIDLVIIHPGERTDSRFLEYILNSDWARRRIEENSVGSIQSHFNVGAMKSMSIPSIDLEEQRKRVISLDRAVSRMDELLGALGRQDDLLMERREALITAAVTGVIDVTTARG